MMTSDINPKISVTTPSHRTRVVACIPTYNEQETIGEVVKKTLQHVEKVYLVDDASIDMTVERAKAQGALVIMHDQRKGLGQTLHDLIEASIKDNPDVIVILEGDNQIYPELVPDFLQPVLNREAEVVFGLVREYSSTLSEEDDESTEGVEGEGTENASTLAIRVLTLAAARRFLDLEGSLLGELEHEVNYAKKSGLIANVLIIEVDSEDSASKDTSEAAQVPEETSVVETQSTPPPQIESPPKPAPAFESGVRILAALALVAVLAGAFLVLNSGFVSKPDYMLVIQAPQGSGSMNLEAGSYLLSQGNSSRIEAIPSLGWSFDYWIINNSTRDYTNPITIQLDGDRSLRARFSQVKNVLTVACVGSGSTTPSVGAYAHEINSTIQVTVTPMTGWQLVGWALDGGTVNGGDTYSLVMDSDHMLVAVLSPIQCKLDVEILGQGTINKIPDLSTYPYGSDVLISTTPSQGWVFKLWSGDASGSNDTISVTMTGDKSVTAEFTKSPDQAETYTLTIEFPQGKGWTSPLNGAYSFTNGSRIEIEAIADEGWQFDHWVLDDQYMDFSSPLTLVVSVNQTVKPIFIETGSTFPADQTYSLSLNIIGSGNGSINLSPSGGNYPAGTVVTLTAVSAANSSFTSWGGDLSGVLNPATITMDSAKDVTADFTLSLFTVSLVQVGQGTATITPSGPYVYGSTIDLTASESASGWSFTGWSSDPSVIVSNPLSPSTTATVYGSGTVTATFTQIMYILSVSTPGTGTGSVVISPAGGSYASGTVVTLEGVPGTGSSFSLWGGDLSGSTNPTTITMDSAKSVTAEFTLIEYTISVSASPGGSVSVSPLQSTYHYGDSVTLTANPDVGYSFVNWSGGITGSANPYTISVDGDLSATANFNLD